MNPIPQSAPPRLTFHPFTMTGATLHLHSKVDLMDALTACHDGLEMLADLFVGEPDNVLCTRTAQNGVFRYLTGIVETLEVVKDQLSQLNLPSTPAAPDRGHP